MLNKLLRFFSVAVFILAMMPVSGQEPNAPVEMADGMRASGKIYVVIAIILTILAGLIFYVARLDRKITRFEKEKS